MIPSLLLLGLGFTSNIASAFTATYSRRWGRGAGRIVTVLLRDVFGIPLWVAGFGVAVADESPALFARTQAAGVIASLAFVAGGLLIIASLAVLGWRSAAPSIGDDLIERGPYACLRHPMHAGTLIEFIGLALFRPTGSVLIACAIGCVWLILQSWLEERDLIERMPAYVEYRRRVPAFFPRFGRGRP